MWQIISAVIFYSMFALLLLLLWMILQNLKTYVQAWQTLMQINQQNADSMQKLVDTVYLLAKDQGTSK